MNSASSPGGSWKRPCRRSRARQASLAAASRSLEEADVPPDVARAFEGLTPEEHHASPLPSGLGRHTVARAEGLHAAGRKPVARDLFRAFDRLDAAILAIVRQRDRDAWR